VVLDLVVRVLAVAGHASRFGRPTQSVLPFRRQLRRRAGSPTHFVVAVVVVGVSRNRAVVLFAVVVLAWGGAYVAIDVGLTALPAVLFAAFRLDVAAVTAVPLAFLLSDRVLPRTRADVLSVAVNGVLVAAFMNAFLFTGQQYTTGAVASILFSTAPVIATGFARGLLPSDRLDSVEFLGLALGLVGLASSSSRRSPHSRAERSANYWCSSGPPTSRSGACS